MTDKNNLPLVAMELNAKTGEVITRELTPEEIAEKEQMKADFLEQENERQAKIAARESALAKLAALGLTEEEIAAL